MTTGDTVQAALHSVQTQLHEHGQQYTQYTVSDVPTLSLEADIRAAGGRLKQPLPLPSGMAGLQARMGKIRKGRYYFSFLIGNALVYMYLMCTVYVTPKTVVPSGQLLGGSDYTDNAMSANTGEYSIWSPYILTAYLSICNVRTASLFSQWDTFSYSYSNCAWQDYAAHTVWTT